MPLVNPAPIGISSALPIKVGGSPNAGVGALASAFDHVHPMIETAGPTPLDIGAWLDAEMARRVGSSIVGRQLSVQRSGVSQSSTSGTLADVTALLTALKSGATYLFAFLISYRTANNATGLDLSVNYTGTVSAVRFTLLGGTGAAAFQSAHINALDSKLGSSTVGPGATDVGIILYGTLVTTSAGNFALRFASGVPPNSVSINPGSAGIVIQQ